MVTINGTAFELFNYQVIAGGVRLTVKNTTTAALEEAIGDSANIAISDEYRGYSMRVTAMSKRYGTPIMHELEFSNPSIEEAVQQNAAELELQAGAIAELAELLTTTEEVEEE